MYSPLKPLAPVNHQIPQPHKQAPRAIEATSHSRILLLPGYKSHHYTDQRVATKFPAAMNGLDEYE